MPLCESSPCRPGGQRSFPLRFSPFLLLPQRSLRPLDVVLPSALLRPLLVASLHPVRTSCTAACHHGRPLLHGWCWLSLLGFYIGSCVGAWVIPSLLSRLEELLCFCICNLLLLLLKDVCSYSTVITVLEAVVARCALPTLSYLCEVAEDGSVLAGVELELPGDGSGPVPRREFFRS